MIQKGEGTKKKFSEQKLALPVVCMLNNFIFLYLLKTCIHHGLLMKALLTANVQLKALCSDVSCNFLGLGSQAYQYFSHRSKSIDLSSCCNI